MSRYKEIKTEFRSAESLLKALADLGMTIEKQGPLHKNAVTMVNVWGHGNKQVDFIARNNGLYWPLGFSWDESQGQYQMVMESMEEYKLSQGGFLGRLTQRYAFNEVVSKAEAQGYLISQENVNGTIRLTCTRR